MAAFFVLLQMITMAVGIVTFLSFVITPGFNYN